MTLSHCLQNLHNAERAIREGRGRLINGRPCRTEKAKAHREFNSISHQQATVTEFLRGIFFVERKYGPIITPEEVREMMSPYGTITSCYTVSSVERTALNLNEGVIVEFEMYDEGQTASSVRNCPASLDAFKAKPPRRSKTMTLSSARQSKAWPVHPVRAQRIEFTLSVILLIGLLSSSAPFLLMSPKTNFDRYLSPLVPLTRCSFG